MTKILLLSVRVYEIGVGVVADTYFFWSKCSWSLMYIKVSLAILLEKGRNLALLLDTRKRMLDAITILLDTRKWMLDVLSNLLDSEKWMLDVLSNLLDSEKQMLENARNRAEI